MKRIFTHLFLVLALAMTVSISADAATRAGKGYDGIYWTVDLEQTLSIKGFGKMENNIAAGAGWESWFKHNISGKYGWEWYPGDVKKIYVETGITHIGESAFNRCDNSTEARIGSGVKTIGGGAFLNNSSMKTVYIPASVNSIGSMAFYLCDSLTDVYYGGTKEQWKAIEIGDSNEDLLNANIHYNQEEFTGDFINSSGYKPANVKAAFASSGDKIKVSWKAVSKVNGYRIYYKAGSGNYTDSKYTTKTSYIFEDLKPGTTYTFKVVPCFTASKIESTQCTEVSYKTMAKMTTPTVVKSSSSKVKVSWTKMEGMSGYQVSKSTKATGTNSIGSTTSSSKTSEVKKNTTYYYKVRAYKKVGDRKVYSPWSDAVSFVLRYVYSASDVDAVLTAENSVKLTWDKASGANAYEVYVKLADGEYSLLTTTEVKELEFAGLEKGMKYTYKVVPVYIENGSVILTGKTDTDSVTTLQKVSAPVIAKSGSKVKVKWVNIPGESGYQISKSTEADGTNIVSTYKTTKGTYKTLSATKGKTYYYKVRAYKMVGKKKVYGEWSDTVEFTR